MGKIRNLVGVFVLVCLLPLSALAQETKAEKARRQVGTFTLQFENDLFYGADRHYTNGIRLSWLSPPKDHGVDPITWVRKFLEKASFALNSNTRLGLAVGQDIFTPEDRHNTNLIADDRPYAGWLYGAMSLHTVTKERTLDTVELNLGIVGPHAFGEETQDLVHEIRLIDTFEGWNHQLRDEPGFHLMWERKWRALETAPDGGLGFDFIPHIGGSVGNVLSHVNIGGAVRFGLNIPQDFGPPALIKGATSLDPPRGKNKWSLYAFAGADGRYVGNNIFLDGNNFRDSHRVDKENIVADLSLGVSLQYNRFKLSYTNALRTREFEGQDNNGWFGSVSLSWQFF